MLVSSNTQLEELKKEISNLKKNTVLRQEYENVQQELQVLKQDMLSMKSEFNDKINALMEEIDEEKKTHLSTKVRKFFVYIHSLTVLFIRLKSIE